MFNISHLRVNYINSIEPTNYEFEQLTYVYGKNNVGKSAMIYALDFVLGKSDVGLNDKEGLDNIFSIELEIQDNVDKLFLKRTINDEYYYKIAKEDEYFQVDDNLYKQEISNFINKGNKKYLDEFFLFNEENLSFRAFTFFNFIDEKGLGNLANIFARSKDYEHQKRARKLMTFLYNYKNIHELCKLNIDEKKLAEKLNSYNEIRINYNYSYKEILKYFVELNIETNGEINELYERFLNYKNGFNRNNESVNRDDLNELIKASYALSEELKYQENLENQSQKLINRNKKSELVLNAFKEIVRDDDHWQRYIENIEELINKNKYNVDVLSIKDYKKTIELIKKKKNKIDQKIYSISKGINKSSYEKTSHILSILEHLFKNINNSKEIVGYEKTKKALEMVQGKIKDLNKKFDNNLIKAFNETILSWYKRLAVNVDFAEEDLGKPGFCIDFNPIQTSLVGKRNYKDDINEKYVYNPGSMARETTWQILGCLTNLKILIDNFQELPFMRLLIVDGINQPFDENPNSYPEVFKLIKEIASEIGIQLIVVSTIDRHNIDGETQLDLSTGFNKAHNM